MQTASKKVINGWAMYDWANSVYNLVITSTIFPAYFEAVTGDGNEATTADKVHFLGREFVNTSLYNYALAFAMLIVAIVSPLLSSIADYKGNKKSFMNFFLTLGSIACAGMFFFTKDTLSVGIITMIVACVGFWGSLVYYNSFLPEIAAPEDRDRVSAKGFAYGYIGSVILQVICFVFVMKPDIFGIPKESTLQYRLCFLLVGIWWWGFGQFSLSRLPKSKPAGLGEQKNILGNGYRELRKVINQLIHLPVLKRYLAAFFFYNLAGFREQGAEVTADGASAYYGVLHAPARRARMGLRTSSAIAAATKFMALATRNAVRHPPLVAPRTLAKGTIREAVPFAV